MSANIFNSVQLSQPIAVAIPCREDHFKQPNNGVHEKREHQPTYADSIQKPQNTAPIAPDIEIMDS